MASAKETSLSGNEKDLRAATEGGGWGDSQYAFWTVYLKRGHTRLTFVLNTFSKSLEETMACFYCFIPLGLKSICYFNELSQ